MKNIWILASMLLLIVPAVMASSNTLLVKTRTGEGLRLIQLTPYLIPGGTGQYLTKGRFLEAQMRGYAQSFPYDLRAAVSWVRNNQLSLIDPVTKKSMLVALMSDENIISYLMQPWGRQLSQIDFAGLPPRTTPITVIRTSSGRLQYQIGGSNELPPSMLASQVGEGMKASFSTPPPKNKVPSEEIAWVRMNVQKVYNPVTKQYVNAMTTPVEEMAKLLQNPKIRESLGLPALQTTS